MNHSLRYQRELNGDEAMDGAALGNRALALIYAGHATHETFQIKKGMALADLMVLINELEAKVPRFWLGKRPQGDFICYESPIPLKRWHGYKFVSAIGPFLSRLSSAYYLRCEHNSRLTWTPAKIECLAHQDKNPVWISIRESILADQSMPVGELDAERRDQAEEYEPDNLFLPESIDITNLLRKTVSMVELPESLV